DSVVPGARGGPWSALAGGVGGLVVDEVAVSVEEGEHERLLAGATVGPGARVIDDPLGAGGPAGRHAVQPGLAIQFPVQVQHPVGRASCRGREWRSEGARELEE